jgi:hypothetical protein
MYRDIGGCKKLPEELLLQPDMGSSELVGKRNMLLSNKDWLKHCCCCWESPDPSPELFWTSKNEF